jgi:hypothetical protein
MSQTAAGASHAVLSLQRGRFLQRTGHYERRDRSECQSSIEQLIIESSIVDVKMTGLV